MSPLFQDFSAYRFGVSYKSPKRDETILDSDIMMCIANYNQNETGNSYVSVFYCGVYVTLWALC